MSSELWIPKTLEEYKELWKWLQSVQDKSLDNWEEAMRWYSKNDLFFLFYFVLSDGKKVHSQYKTPLHWHNYYLDLCKNTQWIIDNQLSSFNGSARGSGKSTVRTKAGSIYLLLNYPDISISIVSVEKQLAKRHQGTINEELENNKLIKLLHPDVLFDDPREAAKNGEAVWSREDGIRVKRSIVRANNTVEHHNFMTGSPTGSRFDVIHYDDCENGKVTSSQDMLNKLHDAFNQSVALATPVVLEQPIIFMTNTIYHPEGIAYKKYQEYRTVDERLAVMHPAENLSVTGDAPGGGTPEYPFTSKSLWMWFDNLGKDKQDYSTQFLCDFNRMSDRSFQKEWIQFVNEPPEKLAKGTNAYVCIDASRGIEDPMFIWVWGAAPEKKLRWIGGSRKKLDPASPQFHDEIFNVVNKANNHALRVVEVRVEQLPNQVWADLVASELRNRGCYIPVVPCKGKVIKTGKFSTAKLEREWQRWSPALQRGDIVFPTPTSARGSGIMTTDEKGVPFDLVDYFLKNEYEMFPRSPNDDGLDSGALIWEPDTNPIAWPPFTMQTRGFWDNPKFSRTSWMSA